MSECVEWDQLTILSLAFLGASALIGIAGAFSVTMIKFTYSATMKIIKDKSK